MDERRSSMRRVRDIGIFPLIISLADLILWFILPMRAHVALNLFLFTSSAIVLSVSVWLLHKKDPKFNFVVAILFTVSMMALFVSSFRYTFIESDLPFWLLSLVIGVMISAVFLALIVRKSKEMKQMPKHPILAYTGLFLVFVFVFFLMVHGFLAHCNYALGSAEGTSETTKILEKDSRHTRKSGTRYYFTVEVEGKELDMEVDASEYYRYEEGDRYTVVRYDGAFDEPFVLPE